MATIVPVLARHQLLVALAAATVWQLTELRGAALDNGVDPGNLGKGDWIYSISDATNQLGGNVASVRDLTSLMVYEKNQGMNFIVVKAGDGADDFPSASPPQFTGDLVYEAHAAGLKIFGYTRSYGTNIPGEISLGTRVNDLGADGFVIDAEVEWESSRLGTNGPLRALQLCQGLKAAHPNKFLAHAPLPIIGNHSSFPYKEFGLYCDAVMPQAYWKSIGVTPSYMVSWMGTEWRIWQNSLTGRYTNAVKPVAPIGQGWSPSASELTTGMEISEFINALKTDTKRVTATGYKGVSFWRADLHSPDMWNALGAATIGTANTHPPVIFNVSACNIADTSATISWHTDVSSDSVVEYGTTTGYGNSITNPQLVYAHSINLTGLSSSTPCHYRVMSKSASAKQTVSRNFTFLTNPTGVITDLIIDNTNATVIGDWFTGTAAGDKFGPDYRFKSRGSGESYLQYTPNFAVAGNYHVSQRHPHGRNRATNTPFVITFFGGIVTNRVNEQLNGGTWNLLGTFPFSAGSAGNVKIRDDASGPAANQILADAIKFTYVPAAVANLAQNITSSNATSTAGSVEIIETDVCVYGGVSAGVAAAVQAARMGKRAVLTEFGNHLGGMTSGGLGATDIGNKAAIGGIAREFYQRVAQHYATDEAWQFERREEYFARRGGRSTLAELNSPGATMWTFEPRVAERILLQMINEARVPVYFQQRLAAVKKDGPRLAEIVMENGKVYRAKMFIDASYEGDLMAKAGVNFTVGREPNDQYHETLNGIRATTPKHQFSVPVDPYVKPGDPSSGLLPFVQLGDGGNPGDGDRCVQAYNFRLCYTKNPLNRLPHTPPSNYDAAKFELLARYLEALVAAGRAPKLGDFWNPIWMPNAKTDINNNGGFSTDFIGLNHDYPNADYAVRAKIWKAHEDYVRGFVYFLATNARVPERIRKEMQEWGPAADEFPDTDHWPHQLYVREARRMVSDYVMTEHNCRGAAMAQDAVGMGAYGIDSHNCRRIVNNGRVENEGDVQVGGFLPYPIAYRSIVPKENECENLFVPVCLAATHIAYGSIRMEPVFMVLGQSSATAACFAIDANTSAQKVDPKKLRARLLADKQILEWKK